MQCNEILCDMQIECVADFSKFEKFKKQAISEKSDTKISVHKLLNYNIAKCIAQLLNYYPKTGTLKSSNL